MRSLLPLLQERGLAAEVRQRMRADTWGAIESASRSDLLPATMMIELEDAIVDARGEQALVEFWRDYTLRSAGTVPIFKPLIDGLMRIFVGPRGVVRVLPRALAMTGRDLGEFSASIHGDGRGADFTYQDLDVALRTRTFALATQGSLEGGFRLVGADAQVGFDESSLSAGVLVMRVRWEDAPDSVRAD